MSHATSITTSLPATGSEFLPDRLPSSADEAHLFWRLRGRLLRAGVQRLFAGSRFRTALVALLSATFWAGLYAMFHEGFTFVHQNIPDELRPQTIRAVFNVFFVSLLIMLLLSAGILMYGSLYRSSEVAMLLSMPVRTERIFIHKLQETVALSSWGFLLLGSPMLVSYGVVVSAPWFYYVLLGPYMLAFVFIPCSIGAIATLLIVRYLPAIRRHLVGSIVVLLLGLALWGIWTVVHLSERDLITSGWFRDMLARLQYSEQRLSPSWWLSSGLLESARTSSSAPGDNPWAESVLFLCLVLANSLLLHQVAAWTSRRIYRTSYSNLVTEWGRRRRTRIAWIDRLASAVAIVIPGDMRQMLVKDLRLFRRDPMQWSQFLIFFGLLAFYFLNIRRFRHDANYSSWLNMISFLNLAVVGLILSTFTTRFVFPMISLEGRRFWILGLLPISRARILWGKFLFASVGSVLPCASLILLSDLMLRIDVRVVVVHQITCLMLCVGLAGIAVGLGARWPDTREASPAKVAAGFGGTLNLVVSALYIVAVIVPAAVPCHLYVDAIRQNLTGLADPDRLMRWIWYGMAANVTLGLAAVLVPMTLGLRAFRRMEF